VLTNTRYILITALRDWLFAGLLAGTVFASVIAAILGSTAFLEEHEMTLTYTAGSARIILMVGMIIFTCFHIRSAFDTKEIDVILSRPISRTNLVIAYWLGFSFVAFLLALPIIAIVGLIGVHEWLGYGVWSLSLILEAFLVVSLSLFSAFTLRSAVTSVMFCMGFYVLSRMMAFFVATSQSHMLADPKFLLPKQLLVALSALVPRLDFFAKSEWLVYGLTSPAQLWHLLLQALVFVPLLLVATTLDFRRKQF
jgi:ABC-type transport system involved in multi-copper enzyme maturation permease subunit